MRVLHIIPGYHSAMGGTFAFVKAWVQSCSEEEVSSVVLALCDESEPIENEGCDVVRLISCSGTYRYSAELVPWLERNIKNFDAAVIHGVWQYHSYGAWRVLHRHSIPYYVFPHGMMDDWFRRTYPFKHLKKCLYWWFAESKVLRDARAVIFTSEDERISSKNGFFPYLIRDVVSALGIAEPPLNEEEQRAAFHAICPEAQGKRIMLFLGRVHRKKGCDLLIRAFAEVYADQSEVVLIMAGPEGEGGYVNELKDLVKKVLPHAIERVIWTGMIQGNCKWGALRCAELFLLPSHQENFGIAVVESLACGAPVFVSNRVNIWREVKGGSAGIVENNSLEGTIKGLREWRSLNSESIHEFRKNSRALYENKYRIQDAVRSLNLILFDRLS